MVPIALKEGGKQNKIPKTKWNEQHLGTEVSTQHFLFVDKFKWKPQADFLSNICALYSRINVAYSVPLDTSYFVTSLHLLSPSFFLSMKNGIQQPWDAVAGSNPSSLGYKALLHQPSKGHLPPWQPLPSFYWCSLIRWSNHETLSSSYKVLSSPIWGIY